MWDLAEILAFASVALRERARLADLEQAPLGLDALDELALHPILRDAFARAGLGMHPEQRYPQGADRPRRSEGERCDIVLTRSPADHLLDPLASGTLFGSRGVEPEDALWLEVKGVGQFIVSDACARANPGYSGQFLAGVTADVRKLAAEPRILWAAVLLVLFNADTATAEHDLGAWTARALERALPISSPLVERFPITDRIGNGVCSVALIRAHHL